MRNPLLLVVLAFVSVNSTCGQEQTVKRPRVAARSSLVLNENVDVQWTGDEDRYAWYEAERESGQTELVVIDMTNGQRLEPKDFPADVPKLLPDGLIPATELGELKRIERSRNGGAETEIEFINRSDIDVELKWVDTDGKQHSYRTIPKGESRKQHTYVNHVWLLCDRKGKPLAATKSTARMVASFTFTGARDSVNTTGLPADEPDSNSRRDSRQSQSAFVRGFNLWLRDPTSGHETALTTDGNDQEGYEGRLWWSPTGDHFAVMKTQFATTRQVTLVDSAPDQQLQPKTITINYAKPGDALDVSRLCVFDKSGETHCEVAKSAIPNPFEIRDVNWRSDGRAVRFVYNQRGHQRLQVIELNVDDGECRILVDEQSQTFIDYAGKYFLQYLDNSDELIWMSERDGWNHLYLIDQKTGQVKNQISPGEWVVRDVVEVDQVNRTLLVAVGGYVSGEDPYYLHLMRVSFDDGSPIELTPGVGQHEWKFSPEKRYFVDRMSRVDMPPRTVIRSLERGQEIAAVETADASNLIETGWTMPQHFQAKGRDGATDIYGVIVFPKGFDKAKKYPVLELIYAGPQSAYVPKSFQRLRDLHRAADGVDGEKQFIVVQIDGMGTSQRSKAFHDVCWKNLGDAGFPDRIEWMKAAAYVVPQMDLTRVGVWGGSAGGQNSLRALLSQGDFYKAAFADCGCHDNRLDKVWWNELWMGWPVDSHYEQQSNVTQAHRLTGKLMLSVGELDTNVDPASTLQVVDALIKADKDFELLFFPGAGHGAGSSEYGVRRRIDFFARAFY